MRPRLLPAPGIDPPFQPAHLEGEDVTGLVLEAVAVQEQDLARLVVPLAVDEEPDLVVHRGEDQIRLAVLLDQGEAVADQPQRRLRVAHLADEDGVDVAEKPFNEKNLFATIFSALGMDPYAEYDLPNLPTFYRVEDHAEPIREVLA